MKCEICQGDDSSVVRTDAMPDGIRRRRECVRCHHRWTTLELPADSAAKLERYRQIVRSLAEVEQ